MQYGPFKMGIQSYSLRAQKLPDALRTTNQLGLGFWEAYPEHIPSENLVRRIYEHRKALADSKIRLIGYGVVSFGADEKAALRTMQFAKYMGIETISADPAPESFRYLAKMANEYKVRIAIHNHGPGSRYDRIEHLEAVMAKEPKIIGLCVDTGHFLRSGVDPSAVVRRWPDRVYGAHLKDVKDRRAWTVLGQGDLDTVGFLKALRAARFNGVLALEYEENPDNPVSDIQACLAYAREAVRRV